MKLSTTAVWLVPALLALTPEIADELVGRAATEDVRTRRFSVSSKLELEEMTVEIDGQTLDPGVMGQMQMNDASTFELEVVDTVLEARDGRATKLSRVYSSGSRTHVHDEGAADGEAVESRLEGTTLLAGREVEFELEDGEFRARFADGEEDADGWLDGLAAELDLSGLLPAGEVEPGDTWEIDPGLITQLLQPGGRIPMEDELEGDTEAISRRLRANAALRDYEGSFRAEYKGLVEVDGVELAEVELTCELQCSVDLTEMMQDEAPEATGPNGEEISVEIVSAELEHALEGGGTLLWNAERGALHSLELELEVRRVGNTGLELGLAGRVVSQVQSMTSSGTTSVRVECE